MHAYHLLAILVLITTIFTYINQKFFKWPVTIAVTILSLFTSLMLLLLHNVFPAITGFITVNINLFKFQEVVMEILLGFLLFGAAFKTDVSLFRKNIRTIASLAFFSTIISTFLMGSLVYFTFRLLHVHISFINCLLFGSLISPTDPIAAIGVLKKVGISPKLEMKITGESLINDGIAIVIFKTIFDTMQAGTQDNVLQNAGLLFLQEAGGGILFGAVVGAIALFFLRSINNYKVEILLTLSVVMGGYTLADALHVSSPIAMVVAGLICSNRGKTGESHLSHQNVHVFWELIEDFINVLLFLFIGLEIFVIPIDEAILLVGGITIFLLFLSRFLSLLPVYFMLRSSFEKKHLTLFTWAALRGAVSIALAISLPGDMHREAFLSITYFIAVFSIIIQGLTIGKLADRLGLGAP